MLIGKYCKQEYGQAELAYKILKPERWVDRQNRSSNEHVHHARFMRPLYQLILEVNPRKGILRPPPYLQSSPLQNDSIVLGTY